ncbi:uncharacterized protein Dana_GF21172 [Drosophila ananassae]|uniref:Uncharacterized protein n=1 Tax=Drosophila ananassae TaxID=7217 RepID=B3MQW9_DROAN|nr:uncharacterized protein LOC6503857 [Drosophila ananassae]EDV34174.1 uncharacterized protein Dana_GF21172 [Drosophila ananassae]
MPVRGDSDSDSEDDAQLRRLREAADTSLLTNSMFQEQSQPAKQSERDNQPREITNRQQDPVSAKSERYLEEQEPATCDLKVTQEMQRHIWSRLSNIIQQQIEFCEEEKRPLGNKKSVPDRVKLVSTADCYLSADVVIEGPQGPQKKPNIMKRLLPEDESSKEHNANLRLISVSGESVLDGKDLRFWAPKKIRADKIFEYKAQGSKLLAVEPDNEFTERRRKNKWDESKIRKRKKNKQ